MPLSPALTRWPGAPASAADLEAVVRSRGYTDVLALPS